MKYPCLGNTDDDDHKRNNVFWGRCNLSAAQSKKKKINCRKPLVICVGVQHKLSVFSAIIENFRGSQSSKLPRGSSSVS